ncbi:MAG: hypothetical protein IPK80_01230 [Nannocystis sp.]|nr:hypothetical protein [Nannocystis sp.]
MDGDRWWGQLVREYAAHQAGVDLASGGRVVARTHAGELCTFGRYERSYAVLLREKEFVTPLAAGSRRAVDEALLFFQQGNNAAAVPVPVVTEAGVKRFFRLVGGAVLVGVATLSTGAILCACQGDQLVFIRADPFGEMDVVSLGRPGSLHDLNMDTLRELGVGIHATERGSRNGRGRGRTAPAGPRAESPKTQAAGGPLRLPARLSAEYDRILARERLAPEDTARVSSALRGCFEALLRRAKKAKVKEEHRSRGGQALPTVTRLLCELALRGAEDLVGLTGRILKKLQEVAGELKLRISPRTLSHALQLLLATKTCLMVREGHTWTIRLEELSDPWSQLHREFLKETPRACRPARAAEATAALREATVDEVREHEEGAADAADAADAANAAAAVDSDATNSEASTMTHEEGAADAADAADAAAAVDSDATNSEASTMTDEEGAADAADAADAAAAVDSDATNSEASTMTDETADDETMSVASTISDDAAATEADPLEAPATPVIIAPEAPAADPPEAPAAPPEATAQPGRPWPRPQEISRRRRLHPPAPLRLLPRRRSA